jgi:ribosomal protein S18 acetylase RimI-like enzyme
VTDEDGLRVEAVLVADPEVLAAVRRLLPQLSRSAPEPTAYGLEDVVSAPATDLFVARDDEDRIVGMLTLAAFRLPTGVRAWIEDVVVDEEARGQGAGAALVRAALERAREAGARTVDLTSRPERTDAHRLYERLGFVVRTTNVYRYDLEAQ